MSSHDQALKKTLKALGESLAPSADQDAEQRVRARLMAFANANQEPLHISRADEGDWEALQPGVTIKRLYVDPESQAVTALWRLEPGTEVDTHFHDMDEECLVLEGDLCVGTSTLLAGDYLLGKKGTSHPGVISRGGALLLIRAQDYRPAA